MSVSYVILRAIVSALCGVMIGAFTNTLEYRLRSKDRLTEENCHCTTCGTTLKLIDQIPILSYFWLRGKCRHCGSRIGIHYPITEGGVMLLHILISLLLAPRVLSVLLLCMTFVMLYVVVRAGKRPVGRYLKGIMLMLMYQVMFGAALAIINIALL